MKKYIYFTFLLFFLILGISNFALAQNPTVTLPNPLCPTDANGNPLDPEKCIDDFPDLITTITDYILTLIAGLAAVIFIWAGILFVTSAGNESRLGSAKKALWWAIIGTAIAVAGKGLIEAIKAVIGITN